jgi:hypothetical protein
MRKELVLRLVSSGTKLSDLLDESTSLSSKSTLAIDIRSFLGGDSPQYVFLDLLEFDSQDAEHIEGKLMNFLKCMVYMKNT